MCAIMFQYVNLRTRYSELMTLTSQYIKFILETQRRLEEEEVNAPKHLSFTNLDRLDLCCFMIDVWGNHPSHGTSTILTQN